MRKLIANLLKRGTLGRWLVSGFYHHPLLFTVVTIRSLVATKRLTGSYYPLRVRLGVGQRISISVGASSKVFLGGNLIVAAWGGSNLVSSVSCGEHSELKIAGDFEIGPNVHILVGTGAQLLLGGKKRSTGSGITCDSRIMVEKLVSIGADSIIAWNVYITDSDWHEIAGAERSVPVSIGDNVWISHDVSILKGAAIPSGCIVGAKSLVTKLFSVEKALIAGIPAKQLRTNVEWER